VIRILRAVIRSMPAATRYYKIVTGDGHPVVGKRAEPFDVGSTHTLASDDGLPILCVKGFHFSRTPLGCLASLPALSPEASYRLLEVEPLDRIFVNPQESHKLVTLSLRVTRELDWATHTTGKFVIESSVLGGGHRKYRKGLLHQDDDDPEPAQSDQSFLTACRFDHWFQNGRPGRGDGGPTYVCRQPSSIRYDWRDDATRAAELPVSLTFDGSGATDVRWRGNDGVTGITAVTGITLQHGRLTVFYGQLDVWAEWRLTGPRGAETVASFAGGTYGGVTVDCLNDAEAARHLATLRRLTPPV
jgi:hypothetical protein